jgi:hypothetical protein
MFLDLVVFDDIQKNALAIKPASDPAWILQISPSWVSAAEVLRSPRLYPACWPEIM